MGITAIFDNAMKSYWISEIMIPALINALETGNTHIVCIFESANYINMYSVLRKHFFGHLLQKHLKKILNTIDTGL